MSVPPEIKTAQETERTHQLLWTISHSLTNLGDKLDDIAVLNQQEVDLLRRLIKERVI